LPEKDQDALIISGKVLQSWSNNNWGETNVKKILILLASSITILFLCNQSFASIQECNNLQVSATSSDVVFESVTCTHSTAKLFADGTIVNMYGSSHGINCTLQTSKLTKNIKIGIQQDYCFLQGGEITIKNPGIYFDISVPQYAKWPDTEGEVTVGLK